MSKSDNRPQTPKQPLKVEVKTALPWTLIVLAIAGFAAFVAGWNFRSEQVTLTDVNWVVSERLEKQPAKK